MDNGAKIRIKVGSMEVEYEGEPSFLKDGLENLLAKIAELSTQVPPEQKPEIATPNGSDVSTVASNGADFSTSTIAAQVDAKSGTELAVCALAKLQLVDKKTSVERAELLAEMKTATAYYNKNMGSNLSASLKTLTTNKRVHQGAGGAYSLSSDERKSIEAKIANIG